MKQIRLGTFETNSSSTHSICIQREEVKELPPYIFFGLSDLNGERKLEGIQHRANYLHTIMVNCLSLTSYIKMQKYIEDTFPEVKMEWAKEKWGKDGFIINYYEIKDSCFDLMLEKIIPNKDMLRRYLFGDKSVIYMLYETSLEEEVGEAKMEKFKEEVEIHGEYEMWNMGD